MPIPFLVPIAIGVASAAAAATGIGAGANALYKNNQAKSINEDSQAMFEEAKTSAENAREKSNASLERLGHIKLNILDASMNRFISVFENIHSIELSNSAEWSNLLSYRLDKQAVLEMREMTSMATSVLGGLVGGAGAGALAAFGAYGATMTFAAASTGTAIASLSGAAATNATLAFLGGGAIAAGGGGIALGTTMLGVAVAGPAIAILGVVMNASASKKLDDAYSNRSETLEAIEGLQIIETLCNSISARADLFSALLRKLDIVFSFLINQLETIVSQRGYDYSKYTEEEQGIVAMSLSIAGAIKKVLDTPVLNEDGSITDDSLSVHEEMSQYTTAMQSTLSLEDCDEEVFELPLTPAEYDDLTLSSTLNILEGETLRYEFKILHIRAAINCEGTLEFSHCVIHYGEDNLLSEIKVKGNGSITMDHCAVECHSYQEQYFISAEAEQQIHFSLCNFINCCSFINAHNGLHFQKCKVINPGSYFLNCLQFATIDETVFIDENLPDFVLASRTWCIIKGGNIHFTGSTVIGLLCINSAEEARSIDKNYRNFINASHITIDNSHFKGMTEVLCGAGKVIDSTFEHCSYIFSQHVLDVLNIRNCSFDKCTEIGQSINSGSRFINCKFNGCYNCLISSSCEGGVQIEYCDFNNWSAINEQHERILPSAMLSFKRTKGDPMVSLIKHCNFSNISAYKYFLIMGQVTSNIDGYVVSVEDCSFDDCTTERNSGKIIKEYDHYFGLFNRRKDVKTVAIASNCCGLDQVRKV